MRLYHGSDVAVSRPRIDFNTGFADLGRGFYLTDDHDVACRRARSRARQMGRGAGVVSVFELDEDGLPQVSWGADGPVVAPTSVLAPASAGEAGQPFGLRFDETPAGIEAWVAYIGACRRGQTAVGELGSPAVVRAWIATQEVEMAFSGFASAAEVAALIDPSELVVQYCLTQQELLDERLSFVEAQELPVA